MSASSIILSISTASSLAVDRILVAAMELKLIFCVAVRGTFNAGSRSGNGFSGPGGTKLIRSRGMQTMTGRWSDSSLAAKTVVTGLHVDCRLLLSKTSSILL